MIFPPPPRELSPRQKTHQQCEHLARQVGAAVYAAENQGIEPAEVWIGPEQHAILLAEATCLIDECKIASSNHQTLSAILAGDLSGTLFFGLIVRRMNTSGVRVGATVSTP